MAQSETIDMTGFFEVLAEAVKPFRSAHNIKGHNVDGCRVIQGRKGGKKDSFMLFMFLARGGDNEVRIEIDMARLIKDPKEYCDQLMESLNEIFKRVRLDQRVSVVVPEQIGKVLSTKQKPSLELIRGALH